MNYGEYIEKEAAIGAIGSMAMKAGGAALKGAKAFGGMSAGKRMATGAAVNAGVKGLTYNGDEGATGRIKSMASGAVTGAVAGNLLSSKNINKLSTGINNITKNTPGATTKLVGAPGPATNTMPKSTPMLGPAAGTTPMSGPILTGTAKSYTPPVGTATVNYKEAIEQWALGLIK